MITEIGREIKIVERIIEIGREIEIAERMIIILKGIEMIAGVVVVVDGGDTMIEGKEKIGREIAVPTILAGIITNTK